MLLGAVGGPKWDNPQSTVRPEQALLGLRRGLELFANLRPIVAHPALLAAAPLKRELIEGVDIMFVRELTGGVYFGQPSERRSGPDGRHAVDTIVYSEVEVARVARLAFQLAQARRKKVTQVDKANILATSRLWREVTHEIAAEFPDVACDDVLVDAMSMHLLRRPRDFDVVVTENMFGDILTDEASVLTGSLGMLPSASVGDGRNRLGLRRGLYEPIHGSAPDIAGKDVANPSARSSHRRCSASTRWAIRRRRARSRRRWAVIDQGLRAPPMFARTAAPSSAARRWATPCGRPSRRRHERRGCRSGGRRGQRGRPRNSPCSRRGIEVADLRLYDTTDEADADTEAAGEPLLPARPSTSRASTSPFSAGRPRRRASSPSARSSGALVIDLTETLTAADAADRAEVNADAVEEGIGRGVYACPTPGATALAVVLKPLEDAAELRRVAVTAFEPTSTAGTPGVDELAQQSRQLLTGESAEIKVFPQRIAFNLIPKVGDFAVGGRTRAEWELERQTRQILSLADLPIVVTCVQTPTFYGQAYSILVETERPLDLDAARAVLRAAPGALLADDDEYPTLADVVGSDATHIGRLRDDPTVPHGLAMWVVIDGLRKGGATNAVQIAELALRARG